MFSLSIHVGEYISMRKLDIVICHFSCSKMANKIHFKSSNIILFNYSHHKSEDKKSYNEKSYQGSFCVSLLYSLKLMCEGVYFYPPCPAVRRALRSAGLRLASSDGDERRVRNTHCVCYTCYYTELYTLIGISMIISFNAV